MIIAGVLALEEEALEKLAAAGGESQQARPAVMRRGLSSAPSGSDDTVDALGSEDTGDLYTPLLRLGPLARVLSATILPHFAASCIDVVFFCMDSAPTCSISKNELIL